MILLLLQNMYYQRVMDKYLQLKCISMILIFQNKDIMILANLAINIRGRQKKFIFELEPADSQNLIHYAQRSINPS